MSKTQDYELCKHIINPSTYMTFYHTNHKCNIQKLIHTYKNHYAYKINSFAPHFR